MKLSDLIAFRNLLLEYDVSDIVYQSERTFESILHTVKTNPIQIRSYTQTLTEDLLNAKDVHAQFNSTLNGIIDGVNLEIEAEEKSYYKQSKDDYESVTKNRYKRIVHSEDILKRIIQMSPETRTMLVNRIKSYIDWKHVGIIIRPGREDFIKHLVECDPLFLVDHDEELLEESVKDFTPEYQDRIRHHYITNTFENPNKQLLETVPTGQAGFCLAYNFLILLKWKHLNNISKKSFTS